MNWNDLRYVLTLSRAGTLAAAARRLNVNQTTVARRLDAVQRALGARLFERVDGAFRPTKAGEAAIGWPICPRRGGSRWPAAVKRWRLCR